MPFICGQGRGWNPAPRHLCQTKSCWCSFLIDFKSARFKILVFPLFFFPCIFPFGIWFLICSSNRCVEKTPMVCSWSQWIRKRCSFCAMSHLFGIINTHFWFGTEFIIIIQLPDYHDIIEHPMDFGTVRKKLDGGLYSNLEQFEVGFLNCSLHFGFI